MTDHKYTLTDIALMCLIMVAIVVTVINYNKLNKISKTEKATATLLKGDRIPDLECDSIGTNVRYNIRTYTGPKYIIVFGLCENCTEEMRIWNRIYRALREQGSNIEIMGYFVEESYKFTAFTDRVPLQIPVYICNSKQCKMSLKVRELTQIYYVEKNKVIHVYTNPMTDNNQTDAQNEIYRNIQLTEPIINDGENNNDNNSK